MQKSARFQKSQKQNDEENKWEKKEMGRKVDKPLNGNTVISYSKVFSYITEG